MVSMRAVIAAAPISLTVVEKIRLGGALFCDCRSELNMGWIRQFDSEVVGEKVSELLGTLQLAPLRRARPPGTPHRATLALPRRCGVLIELVPAGIRQSPAQNGVGETGRIQ
jgi:hypothetical protein